MKKIIINVSPWEKRVALIQDGLLQNIYFSSSASVSLERSFFKGKVAKVLPGVQTAFVDIGQEKAGFLHISEVDRDLAFKRINGFADDEIEEEHGSKKNSGVRDLDITKIFTQGECALVQVSKEPINEKGAKLTTCFALPGRFIVLMPNIPKIGISKRIVDISERKRLKDIVTSILPEGSGCIIRTTCENIKESEVVQDLRYLISLWQEILKRYEAAKPEDIIYSDIDLTLQVVRDHLDANIEEIVCDDAETHARLYSFAKEVAPEYAYKVHLYKGKTPIYDYYLIESQIQQALQPKVELTSGGSIVVESTEAMTVIDVNTGRYVGATKLEETLLKTNMEAAAEIVRQLKLRNIGGLIVIDFIDMASASHRHKLFNYFEQLLRQYDRSQSVVLKISEFGLVQMTRKRSGKALKHCLTEQCCECRGTGFVKAVSSKAHELLRALVTFLLSKPSIQGKKCFITTQASVMSYLIDKEYNSFLVLEKEYKVKITVRDDEAASRLYNFELV